MEEPTITRNRGIRRNVWINAAVIVLLLVGALLGITQMFIVLVVYSLMIAPA